MHKHLLHIHSCALDKYEINLYFEAGKAALWYLLSLLSMIMTAKVRHTLTIELSLWFFQCSPIRTNEHLPSNRSATRTKLRNRPGGTRCTSIFHFLKFYGHNFLWLFGSLWCTSIFMFQSFIGLTFCGCFGVYGVLILCRAFNAAS